MFAHFSVLNCNSNYLQYQRSRACIKGVCSFYCSVFSASLTKTEQGCPEDTELVSYPRTVKEELGIRYELEKNKVLFYKNVILMNKNNKFVFFTCL